MKVIIDLGTFLNSLFSSYKIYFKLHTRLICMFLNNSNYHKDVETVEVRGGVQKHWNGLIF